MVSMRAQLRERRSQISKYPECWSRASAVIRRLANEQCQWCGGWTEKLETHHIGTPYANGHPGNPKDKHDIRRENLVAICIFCHDDIEDVIAIREEKHRRGMERRRKRERHRALGVGTGLVPYRPPMEMESYYLSQSSAAILEPVNK